MRITLPDGDGYFQVPRRLYTRLLDLPHAQRDVALFVLAAARWEPWTWRCRATGEDVHIPAGAVLGSAAAVADHLGVSRHAARRALEALRDAGLLSLTITRHYTIIAPVSLEPTAHEPRENRARTAPEPRENRAPHLHVDPPAIPAESTMTQCGERARAAHEPRTSRARAAHEPQHQRVETRDGRRKTEEDTPPTPRKRGARRKLPDPPPDALRLAERFLAWQLAHHEQRTGSPHGRASRREQALAQDADAIRLMLQRDRRRVEDIERVLDWLPYAETRGTFCWADVVQSGRKLRAQFDRLLAEARKPPKHGRRPAYNDPGKIGLEERRRQAIRLLGIDTTAHTTTAKEGAR